MKINPPIAEVSTPLFEREGMGVSLMKKTYIAPVTNEVHIMGGSVLVGSSVEFSNETVSESSDIGFTKENDGDWSDIWE